MKISNFEKWNEEMFKRYDPDGYYNHPNPIVKYIENKRVSCVLRLLKPKKEDKILDIGCGSGHFLEKIDKGSLTGLDISKYILNVAKKRLANKDNITLIKGDAQKLPFKTKFDKIICTEVIEHVPNPKMVINEMSKIVKKESIIIITIPNEKLINSLKKIFIKLKLFRLLFKNISKEMNKDWHLHIFDINTFKELIKNKLKIIKIKRIPFFFLPIRYVIECKII